MPITVNNLTPDRTFDADSVSIDELADVLGTLINDIQSGAYVGTAWTVVNSTVDRAIDALATSINELADATATLIIDNPNTFVLRSIVVSSMSVISVIDCDSVSISELASALGSLLPLSVGGSMQAMIFTPGLSQAQVRRG